MNRKTILTAVVLAAVAVLTVGCITHGKQSRPEPPSVTTTPPEAVPLKTTPPTTESGTESRTEPPETTTEATTEPARTAYTLTAAERDLVERVVMAEAGGEEQIGQLIVAQCIRNACELDGIRPAEVVTRYQYAQSRPEPSDLVRASVRTVFDEGVRFVDPETLYFYAPARCVSEWHEAQELVAEVGGHKFFKARKE